MRDVTFVNRTSKTLVGVFNSVEREFEPGVEYRIPEYEAAVYRNQNPIMGTDDVESGNCEFKVAIMEWNDPLDDLGDLVDSDERLDRSKIPSLGETVEKVEIKGGLYGSQAPSNGFVTTEFV